MATGVPSLSEILLRRQSELFLHLASGPIVDLSGAGSVREVSFPHYSPIRPVSWKTLDGGGFAWLDRQEAAAFWHRVDDGPQVTVAAAYLTWEPPGQTASLLAAANLPAAIQWSSPSTGLLRVKLAVADFERESPPHGMVAMGAEFFTSPGVTTMYALAGQDKAFVQTTLGGLETLLRRDTTLQDLSARSTRSRVPFVPQEDAELAAAVTLVKRRLELMLAAAT